MKFLTRSLWKRLFGISATDKPRNQDGWSFKAGQLTISLASIPELTLAGTAMRFEGKSLPSRVLVVCDEDNQYHAFQNRCAHLGHRRLDYVPGTHSVQCCSVNKSTYDFGGKCIYGPAPRPIRTYSVEVRTDELRIRIS